MARMSRKVVKKPKHKVASKKVKGFKVSTYFDDGRIYFYYVNSPDSAREHAAAIVTGGYIHSDGKGHFVHYPAHRISKVVVTGRGVPTNYLDQSEGV